MRYRNNEFCITPEEIAAETANKCGCDGDNWYKNENSAKDMENMCDDKCTENLMRKLSELQFAAIDLNLFLDTHPCDEEALKMFKKVVKTIETVKMDYIRKYGPLKAGDSADEVPFEWKSCKFKWPWEK